MTMNGHQTVTSAPLDLRTTTRERSPANGLSTPILKTRCRDTRFAAEVTADSPPALQGTNEDCTGNSQSTVAREVAGYNRECLTALEKGNPEILETKHSPGCALGSETDSRQRRAAVKSSSKLPFRKRPFPTEGDITGKSATPLDNGNRLSPERNTHLKRQCSLQKVFKTEDIDDRGYKTQINPRCLATGSFEEVQDGYQVQAFQPYCHPPGYSVYQWPHLIPLPQPMSPLPQPQQAEQLLADVAMATHPDEDGDTALHIAVARGEKVLVLRLIELLVLAKRDLDIYNNLRQTPLHLAVITDQAALVEALLSAGADPAALDRNGQTAVHLCCEHDQRNCLSVVLSHASSSSLSSTSPCLDIRNYEGLTPLHLAVQGDRKYLVRMLLDAGADINAMDVKSGQSPLTHAVGSNNTEMVHFLIENGCDVNGQSYSGNTALHSACGRGQVDTVRLLLWNGADSSLKNYHNDTPVMVAKNKKVTDVLRGRSSKHSRAHEQNMTVASPCTVTQHLQSRVSGEKIHAQGSPSPNRNVEGSPSTTPHTPHHSASQSPRGAISFSPPSQSTEGLLGRDSPMDSQPSQRNSSNLMDIRLDQTVALPYPLYVSPLHHTPYAESTRGALLAGHPALCPPISHRAFFSEHPFILLPSNTPYSTLSVTHLALDSRPASRCSNQSDTSTMSISSGGKGDS